jgi:hypothetical protein
MFHQNDLFQSIYEKRRKEFIVVENNELKR